ncbi:MAG: mannonate dehydratase [Bacteroidota bacterium]
MDYLKKTFRWFGPSFGVSLGDIVQLGVEGIVTACHDVPVGEVWSVQTISKIKQAIEECQMEWSVVESVNIHQSIKYGQEGRDVYIENYIQTLKNLAVCGIFTVCYNFMPLIDWTRTDLHFKLKNGTVSSYFDPIAVVAFELCILNRKAAYTLYDEETQAKAISYFKSLTLEERKMLEESTLAGMPGSKQLTDKKVFSERLHLASRMDKSELQENLAYFLKRVIPEAEKLGVRMAIHPDDPPFPVFGIARIVSTYEDLEYVFNSCPSPSNGFTFCSGSLGASATNDLEKIIRDFGSKIHFIHLRNITRETNGAFYEASHLDGSLSMSKIMLSLIKEQRKRYEQGNGKVAIPMRPDHGHVVLDDLSRQEEFYPGYSAIGRGLGLAALSGLEQGIREILL